MRRFAIVVLVVFALFQLGIWASAARADSIEITNEVWGSYQEYLGRIGSTNPGAFAVSRDGNSSYYVYCRDIRCVSGQTYRHEAITRCESMTGRECILFAMRGDIQVAYTLEPKATTPTPASPAVTALVEEEEPPFESPLADGTIVLSRKIAKQLESYLAAVDNQGVKGFFYVAPNGREAGSFVCDQKGSVGLPLCPMKPVGNYTDPKPDLSQARDQARGICEADNDGACVMLFSSDTQRADYKIVQ